MTFFSSSHDAPKTQNPLKVEANDAVKSRNPTKLIEIFELFSADDDPGVEGTVLEPVAPASMEALAFEF